LTTSFLQLPILQQALLMTFVEQLLKWNKAYNLTAITEQAAVLTKHIDDSLAINPYLHGDRILDVGTGAGFPGIPLAISNPDKQFILLDSNGKKIRFIKQMIQVLSLPNVIAQQVRVEEWQDEDGFSTIVTRAFAAICDMLSGTQHLLAKDGIFLAMKGHVTDEELAKIPAEFLVSAIYPIQVPQLDAERNIVLISRDIK
jgi:16S rRNA (guanine527-N7)-methyltransferase